MADGVKKGRTVKASEKRIWTAPELRPKAAAK